MPSGPEWIIVLVIVLLIFGGSQLPKLARNLGKAQKEFKDGLADGQADTPKPTSASSEVDPRRRPNPAPSPDELTVAAPAGRLSRRRPTSGGA